MTILHQAAQKAVEALTAVRYDKSFCCLKEERTQAVVVKALSALESALQQQEVPSGVVIPPAPPECETEDEKTAFAFGYWQGLHAARKGQEVPREPVARWLGDLLTKMPTLDPLWSADVKLGWYRCFDSLRALAASPSTTQQQEAGNEPDAMEAHRTNGLAWAVSCWQAEVMNRPLVNVHRRTLDDTWRQVIRYFGGDPDELLGPNHDTLHMRAQEERAWKP